jgi:hypothetical protein
MLKLIAINPSLNYRQHQIAIRQSIQLNPMWLYNIIRTQLIITAVTFLFVSCVSEEKKTARLPDAYPNLPSVKEKQLNISVLIDLSNRIDPSKSNKQPNQAERDISIINVLTSAIKKNIVAHGTFRANAKINVYFHPEPNDQRIRDIADKLSVSWTSGNNMDQARLNKINYLKLDSNFSSGLKQIYSIASATSYYPGSDTWRFMKDEVKMKCIEEDSSYRNILVILTDGYLYYKDGREQDGPNRYNYIERTMPHFNRFRNTASLNEFESKNYGLIPANKSLGKLEVLVMEVSPEEGFPQDFDIIKKYWCKWLGEMGVKHAEIYKTQQPAYHEKIIAGFLNSTGGICQ